MKVLHISYGDLFGGANKAAFNIHKSLLSLGVDSEMLVMFKSSDDETVIGINHKYPLIYYKTKFKQQIEKIILTLQKSDNQTLHSLNLFSSGVHKLINNMNVDLVNLHWVNFEMLSISEIAKIKKPIVWTLADMWPYCGSEHYDEVDAQSRYIDGYLKNNRPPNHRGIDLDAFSWKRKKKYWETKNINLIATCQWNATCAQNSALFKKSRIDIVPQCVDVNIFKPLDKHLSRKAFNLPQEKKLILFAAPNPTKDKRKGFHLLKKSLEIISKNILCDKLELIVLGLSSGDIEKILGIKTHYINFLYDDISRALLYNSSDVLVAPSIQENLSNIVMEALASSLPTVAFNIGGMPDLIDHDVNGYLATPFDHEDFAKGIMSVFQSNHKLMLLSNKARKKAEKCYSSATVASQYQLIYNEILS